MNFTVPEMSCGHCTSSIEKAIKAADPAATVDCDIAERRVSVQSSLPLADLTSAIKEAGYASEQIAG